MLIGMAAGYTENKGDFGNSGGDFKLNETTGTVYAGYGDGPWYVGVSMLVGDLDYNTTRNITLGARRRAPSPATPAAGTYAFRLLGGYWFKTSSDLVHGPFAKVAYQDIIVRGFSENGSSSTTLRYDQQDRESLQTSLGWQVGGQVGPGPSVRARDVGVRSEGRPAQRAGALGHAGRPVHGPRATSPTTTGSSTRSARRPTSAASPATSRARAPPARATATATRVTVGLRVPAVTQSKPQQQRGRPRGGLVVSGRPQRFSRDSRRASARSDARQRSPAIARGPYHDVISPSTRCAGLPRALGERLRVAGAKRVRLGRHAGCARRRATRDRRRRAPDSARSAGAGSVSQPARASVAPM